MLLISFGLGYTSGELVRSAAGIGKPVKVLPLKRETPPSVPNQRFPAASWNIRRMYWLICSPPVEKLTNPLQGALPKGAVPAGFPAGTVPDPTRLSLDKTGLSCPLQEAMSSSANSGAQNGLCREQVSMGRWSMSGSVEDSTAYVALSIAVVLSSMPSADGGGAVGRIGAVALTSPDAPPPPGHKCRGYELRPLKGTLKLDSSSAVE